MPWDVSGLQSTTSGLAGVHQKEHHGSVAPMCGLED
jgi:hypothetical protein